MNSLQPPNHHHFQATLFQGTAEPCYFYTVTTWQNRALRGLKPGYLWISVLCHGPHLSSPPRPVTNTLITQFKVLQAWQTEQRQSHMQILPKYSGITKGGAVTSPSVEAQGHKFESYGRKVLVTGWRGFHQLVIFLFPQGKRVRLFLFQI